MASSLEELFSLHLRNLKLPEAQREFRFAAPRKWRFDFCWPEIKLAVEIEGGVYRMGRHQRPAGFSADIEKYNAATMLGWRVLRGDAQMVKSGELADIAKQIITENEDKQVGELAV